MPETVPCNGTLVFAEMCAFLNRTMDTSRFRLRMGLLRETNGVYKVMNRSNIIINSNDPDATQGCGKLTQLQWLVNQGDRIGVQINDTCVTDTRSRLICPAQANLIGTASCASALYLPFGTSPLTNFTTVGVNLNIRVSVGECIALFSLHTIKIICIFTSHSLIFITELNFLKQSHQLHLRYLLQCKNQE